MSLKLESTANEMTHITQQNMMILQQISYEIIAYLKQHKSEPEISKEVH